MDREKRDQSTLDQIEKTRGDNNVLWMEILRIAVMRAPDVTRQILEKIRMNDLRISGLVGHLTEKEEEPKIGEEGCPHGLRFGDDYNSTLICMRLCRKEDKEACREQSPGYKEEEEENP